MGSFDATFFRAVCAAADRIDEISTMPFDMPLALRGPSDFFRPQAKVLGSPSAMVTARRPSLKALSVAY